MKALVTGANGLIGANLVRALLAEGHEVRAFVRRTSNLASLAGLPVEIVYGDILQPESLRAAADGCELVGWIASGVDPDMACREENLALLDARLGVPRLGDLPPVRGPDPAVLASRIVPPP